MGKDDAPTCAMCGQAMIRSGEFWYIKRLPRSDGSLVPAQKAVEWICATCCRLADGRLDRSKSSLMRVES